MELWSRLGNLSNTCRLEIQNMPSRLEQQKMVSRTMEAVFKPNRIFGESEAGGTKDAKRSCGAGCGLHGISEDFEAGGPECAKWSHGASCWLYEIFKNLKSGGPNVPLVGHVEYLGA